MCVKKCIQLLGISISLRRFFDSKMSGIIVQACAEKCEKVWSWFGQNKDYFIGMLSQMLSLLQNDLISIPMAD